MNVYSIDQLVPNINIYKIYKTIMYNKGLNHKKILGKKKSIQHSLNCKIGKNV